MKEVQDVYATLREYRPGFPPANPETHPFAVYIRFADGTHSQEDLCRTLRDCLLVGNGMLAALMAVQAGGNKYAVNVVFDPRFERP